MEGTLIVKVLVAIDESEVSRKAVDLIGTLFGRRQDVDVTLFHVVESLPEFILARSHQGGADNAYRKVADECAEACRTQGSKLLADAAQKLTTGGLTAGSIATKLSQKEGRPEARRVVAALAIIEEMKHGNYDLVFIGRRSSAACADTFIGGVAEKVTREAGGRTVCIVD